ncbi:MAG TPA: hypothetical protein VIQ00_11550 [Chitinophagaceae bacterium]
MKFSKDKRSVRLASDHDCQRSDREKITAVLTCGEDRYFLFDVKNSSSSSSKKINWICYTSNRLEAQ